MAIRSTRVQLEEFRESFIWKDIVDELRTLDKLALFEYDRVGEHYKDREGNLVMPNTSETLIHLGDIKGRRKAVAHFLLIPDVLMGMLEKSTSKESKSE